MVVGIVATGLIARVLGPDRFGLLSYCQALVFIVGVVATIGLEYVAVRELIKNPDEQGALMANAFALRILGAFASLVGACLAIRALKPGSSEAIVVTLLFASALVMQASDVIDYRYQADMRSKRIAILKISAFLILSGARIIGVALDTSLLFFAGTYAVESMLTAYLLFRAAKKDGKNFHLHQATLTGCKRLVQICWPLILTNASIAMYYRVDQLMLGRLASNEAVGFFAAAVRISEAWYFVPTAIMAAAAPALALSQQDSHALYMQRLAKVTRVLTKLGMLFALVCGLGAASIVKWLYGPE